MYHPEYGLDWARAQERLPGLGALLHRVTDGCPSVMLTEGEGRQWLHPIHLPFLVADHTGGSPLADLDILTDRQLDDEGRARHLWGRARRRWLSPPPGWRPPSTPPVIGDPASPVRGALGHGCVCVYRSPNLRRYHLGIYPHHDPYTPCGLWRERRRDDPDCHLFFYAHSVSDVTAVKARIRQGCDQLLMGRDNSYALRDEFTPDHLTAWLARIVWDVYHDWVGRNP